MHHAIVLSFGIVNGCHLHHMRLMGDGKRIFDIRITENEAAILRARAEKTGRNRSNIMREFIRPLAPKPREPRAKAR